MTESLLSHADLEELADGASPAAAEQLVAAAVAGRLADPADTGYAYLLAAGIYEDVDELAQALALAERALAAYQQAGPERAGPSRAARARLLLQLGRTGEAMAELGALRPLMASDRSAAAYVPEALAAGGRGDTALEWLAEALDSVAPTDPKVVDQLLATRDRIRGEAGDEDGDGADTDTDDRDLAGGDLDDGADYPYPDPDFAGRGGDGDPDGAVLLVWPEAAYDEVDQRWPELLEPTGAESWDEYREYCQGFIVDWVRRSRTPLLAVLGDADEFEEWLAEQGADPYQSNLVALAREYGDHLASQGDPVELPPEPDAPCWCGSGVSYARCCRRLTPR